MHLLVATVTEAGTAERRHAVVLLGLGRSVAQAGQLGDELIQRTVELIAKMGRAATDDGAEAVALVATEAIRNAADSAQLQERLLQRTGQRLRILSGEAEARLSYLGGCAFRVPPGVPATVLDVGGGSTEVVHGLGTEPERGTSLKLGSDRILIAVGADDPPTARQRAEASALISMTLESAPERDGPGELIATGGTAANLPVLLGLRPPLPDAGSELSSEDGLEGWTRLGPEQLERGLQLTRDRTSSEVARTTGLPPERARLMAGGLLVIVGLLERYSREELVVTERGLRDGVLLRLAGTRVPA